MAFFDSSFFAPVPVLWFGYDPDCPGCSTLRPMVDRLEQSLRKQIIVKRVNAHYEAHKFPTPLLEVPSLLLQVDGNPKLWKLKIEDVQDDKALLDCLTQGLDELGWR